METDKKVGFICRRCGCCCIHNDTYEPAMFLNRADGVCKYYDEANKACTIYDFRPDFCRVDKTYSMFKDKMTWEEYVEYAYECCEALRRMEKVKILDELKEKETVKEDTNYIEEKEEDLDYIFDDDEDFFGSE